MYDFLRGRVAAIDTRGNCSFEVYGVGYLLRISEQSRQAIPLDGSETVLHTRLQVKEDDLQLFGFADVAERAAFDLLVSVQGIGPSIAMEVLSAHPVNELRAALQRGDAAAMQRVKGIGRKSAERIVLELADKVDRIPGALPEELRSDGTAPVPADDLAFRGLIALGFGSKEAGDALGRIDQHLQEPGERVRAALRLLR
ncbi:MAG: Holliday junction branch migration protein RuvA [Planctomycetota bacterium]